MPLSEKHRSELFSYFEPRLGTDVTEAMLQEFPRYAGQELVTRQYLDLRLEALSASIDAKLFGVRGDLSGRMTSLFVGVTTILLAAMAIATTVIIATVG